VSAMNQVRRTLARFWGDYDIWLSPTTAETSSAWGRYHLSSPIVNNHQYGFEIPIQCTIPHNIMGTPAISLPLFMSSQGLPIGVQLAASPALDHLVLQLARQLEIALPWASRSNASRELCSNA
jgi:amidase